MFIEGLNLTISREKNDVAFVDGTPQYNVNCTKTSAISLDALNVSDHLNYTDQILRVKSTKVQ